MNKINKDNFKQDDYKYGFVTEIENEKFPKGLNEDIIKLISSKKNEPECRFFSARKSGPFRDALENVAFLVIEQSICLADFCNFSFLFLYFCCFLRNKCTCVIICLFKFLNIVFILE